jgi:hypothetical protein
LTDGREWRSPYYNEPAEPILGCQFDEAGEMPGELLATMFQTTAEDGSPLESEALAMGPTSVLPKQRAVGSIPIARSGSPLFGPFSDARRHLLEPAKFPGESPKTTISLIPPLARPQSRQILSLTGRHCPRPEGS